MSTHIFFSSFNASETILNLEAITRLYPPLSLEAACMAHSHLVHTQNSIAKKKDEHTNEA